MKKLLLTFSIVCLFISCETKYYSVLVKNESTKTVSYTYNGSSDTLDPSASKAYEVEAYTRPPADIKDEHGIASIEIQRNEDIFTFKDAEPIIFNVANTLPFEVRIKADNYIWYEYEEEGKKYVSFELSVPAQKEIPNEERPDDLFIYTETPKFTATADYSVSCEWKIIDLEELDASGNPKKKLSLIIR